MASWESCLLIIITRLAFLLTNPLISDRLVLSIAGVRLTNVGFLLVGLTLITLFWSLRYATNVERGSTSNLLIFFLLLILITLVVFFIFDSLLKVYISFELSVLPIFMIVIGWGYQRERLAASLRLLFYTLTASMPLLISLIWLRTQVSSPGLHSVFSRVTLNESQLRGAFGLAIFLAFAVKLPIFGVHMWLPKAHVEAPVIGSMALAAILLKLGRYGLWLFLPIYFCQPFSGFWFSLSLVGTLSVRVLCLRLRDLKIIIAYSSVGHMGLMAASLFIGTKIGIRGAVFLMIAHGIRSSAMFIIAFVLYQTNHSRRLLLRKGILSWCGATPLFWFLILIANIASPPTFNLLAEVLVIAIIVVANKLNILLMVLIVIARTGYSLIMYSSSIQGRRLVTSSRKLIFINDLIIFLNHLVWVFLMMTGLGVLSIS